jgi:hypothetical protein
LVPLCFGKYAKSPGQKAGQCPRLDGLAAILTEPFAAILDAGRAAAANPAEIIEDVLSRFR